MDNEFNNQNMNQFENNNMNNEYSNNYNNLSNQNNKKGNNGLTFALIVIIILLAVLCLYLFMDKNDSSKANSIGDKVLDEYYLKTTDIIDEHIQKYKYSSLIDNENKVSYSEFYKAYTVKNIIDSLEPVSKITEDDESQNKEYDKNGAKYPNYCDNQTPSYDCAEEYAKELGLTVDEISRMDKSVWPDVISGVGIEIYMYDVNELKNKYLDIYNDLFNSSFSILLDHKTYDINFGYSYFYDKNLNKIVKSLAYGLTPEGYGRVIIETEEEENLYKVRFVEVYLPVGDWMTLDIGLSEDISNENEVKEYVKRNKDKFNNYEITFEKVDTGYKYKSIKKVDNNKLDYEIKLVEGNKELYVNDKKVNGVKANSELGDLEVKELKDLLIVDEQNPGPSRRLFVVDKNGNASEIDYKVSTYNQEFINSIDSYRVEDNNLYIKVNRQWGNGYIDWYCRYEDKNEVAEYEVKYEYVNGKLENKQVLNEVTIADKYKNESCINSTKVCEGKRDAVYYGEYNEKEGNFTYNINTTLTLNADGTFFQDYKNSEPIQGIYTLSNNKLIISHCPSVGSCDEKVTSTHDVSSDCSTINWGDYNLYLK